MLDFSPAGLDGLLKADPELRYKLKGFDGRFRLTLGTTSLDLALEDGEIVGLVDPVGDAELELVIPSDVLEGASKTVPEPGTESAFVAQMRGVQMRGDMQTRVAPYAGAISRVFDLLRVANGGAEVALEEAGHLFKHTDTAVGRYVYISVDDVEYRVYYEESGSGEEVMVLQHTAGADSRQWHNQLSDPELQRRFRMIAWDLPYHGRSLPPLAERWWEQPYLPTKDWMMKVVVALIDALELDRPVFLGCSVGGQLALDLAANYPTRFGAYLALNGTLDNAQAGDPFAAAWNDRCRDNRVSTELYATGNFNATSPLAPEPLRRELYWLYRSSFPGIYAGDNDYFMVEHDLKIDGHQMRPDEVPIYAIAGEYDPVACDEMHGGPAVARAFPGVTYRELPGIGHFAPVDTPIEFRDSMLPIFDEVLEHLRGTAAVLAR